MNRDVKNKYIDVKQYDTQNVMEGMTNELYNVDIMNIEILI